MKEGENRGEGGNTGDGNDGGRGQLMGAEESNSWSLFG